MKVDKVSKSSKMDLIYEESSFMMGAETGALTVCLVAIKKRKLRKAKESRNICEIL